MKIILTKDLENLGKAGALVEVKPGYGRNYLLPRQLAVLATAKNVRQLDHQKSGILARAAKEKANLEAMAKKLNAIEVKFARKVDALPSGVDAQLGADGLSLLYVERRGAEPAAKVLERLYGAGLPVADVAVHSSSLEDVLLRVLRGAA